MRDTEVLGAGDPGAVEALFGGPTRRGAELALAEAYRRFGFLAADLDPLGLHAPLARDELDPALYGLSEEEAVPLREAYCRSLGWEIGHVLDSPRRAWLANVAETPWSPSAACRTRALSLIASGELLEAAFDRRMPTAKTFGLSGAEGYLVLLAEVLSNGRAAGLERTVIGGMHRGRLTQCALVFGKPLPRIVADAQGLPEFPEDVGASSDSPYHMGWEGAIETPAGEMSIWLAPHPSHLSVVAPVAQGRARAESAAGRAVLPLSLHTDAALAGQGVNMETFQLAGVGPFDIGGTIHLVLDNQVGFTTGAEDARTSRSCTDVARLTEVPVLHVNGDDPDAVIRAAEVAVAYRSRFASDIVVNLIAYRRKGHNEIDDPRFTQPEMYRRIAALPPLSRRYGNRIGEVADTGDLSARLDDAFLLARNWRPNQVPAPPGLAGDIEAQMLAPVSTDLAPDETRRLGELLCRVPDGVQPHQKLAGFLEARRKMLSEGEVDWATAEALALASVLEAELPVRLGGQDSVRGAFTQRHLDIHCQASGRVHPVLGGFAGRAKVFNTPLAENAVLAFEYGHSLAAPGLTVWEAQFGDFLNTAQAIFDQFIICGEDRWLFASNLVMILPHGVDGGGPDHATAHPERLLAACARGNIQVLNLTSPANWFHALRRQVMAPWKKPLVLLAPKALLRHPDARSDVVELAGSFKPVISLARGAAPRVVMASGKLGILLEAALGHREDVAVVRLEQLYPLPEDAVRKALSAHPDADLVWAQEEPENFGPFQWLDRRLERIAGRRWHLVSRASSPSASAGPKSWDDARLADVIDWALNAPVP
ncbi:MAG: thiamine pyrophosphate-dependent enzyme [Pseudomonadota bacterium]